MDALHKLGGSFTSRDRLASYRRKAEKFTFSTIGKDWRHWRESIAPQVCPIAIDDGKAYTADVHALGEFTDATLIDKEAQRWYCDEDELSREMICPGVAKLRTARFTMYIPLTYHTESSGATHYLRDAERVPRGSDEDAHQSAMRAAARMADNCAEIEAEIEREYRAEEDRNMRAEEARARIHELNRIAIPLIRDAKTYGPEFPLSVCAAIRSRIQAMLEDRAEQWKIIRECTQ